MTADMRTFNSRSAWDALSPEQQSQVGAAALLLDIASKAQSDLGLDYETMVRWSRAEQAAWLRLGAIGPDPDDYPAGPDATDCEAP